MTVGTLGPLMTPVHPDGSVPLDIGVVVPSSAVHPRVVPPPQEKAHCEQLTVNRLQELRGDGLLSVLVV